MVQLEVPPQWSPHSDTSGVIDTGATDTDDTTGTIDTGTTDNRTFDSDTTDTGVRAWPGVSPHSDTFFLQRATPGQGGGYRATHKNTGACWIVEKVLELTNTK